MAASALPATGGRWIVSGNPVTRSGQNDSSGLPLWAIDRHLWSPWQDNGDCRRASTGLRS